MTPIIIRTSDRGQFKKCREFWNFTSRIRMDYDYIPGIKALDFGTAIHKGMDVLYNPETWGIDRSVTQQLALASFVETLTQQRKRIEEAQGRVFDDEQRLDFQERRELGVGMLEHYFLWAPMQDAYLRPLFVEVEFEVPIPGLPGYVYQGRVDVIWEDIRDGTIWIGDHKTAAQFGDQSHLDLDQQCGSYGWALKHHLGLDVQGVIYNELRKKVPEPPAVLKNGRLSQNKSQNTTPEIFIRTCIELGQNPKDYADFIQTLREEGQEYFRRAQVHRTAKEYEILEQNIRLEALDMTQDPSIYPNPSQWNCRGCQFKTPCVMKQDGSDYQWFLDHSGYYQKRSNSNG